MYPRQLKTLFCVAVAWLACACYSPAEVREVARIPIGSTQSGWTFADLQGYFGQSKLALTPAGDLLSFSSRRDGPWQLARVRGWAGKTPLIDHLNLPGYYSLEDRHDLETLELDLFMVPEGRFAVCAASAWWDHRVHGVSQGKSRSETTLTVIDLDTFQPVKSFKTTSLDLLEFQGVTMDHRGRIVMNSSAKNKGDHLFQVLDLPNLIPGPRCRYATWQDERFQSHSKVADEEGCRAALGDEPLEQFLAELVPENGKGAIGYQCTTPQYEYCPQPDRFAPDGRFAAGALVEGHDTLLGSWTETRAMLILFSVHEKRQIGLLDMTKAGGTAMLATASQKDYILWLVNGNELRVYELNDPSESPS